MLFAVSHSNTWIHLKPPGSCLGPDSEAAGELGPSGAGGQAAQGAPRVPQGFLYPAFCGFASSRPRGVQAGTSV